MATIKVYSPNSLRSEFEDRYQDGVIKSSLANFGNPPYGSKLLGHLFKPPHDSMFACDPLPPMSWNIEDQYTAPVLLIKRGQCTFDIKVRHAQEIGARVVIVYDDRPENVDLVIMGDSGQGGNLFIPSLLISNEDGTLLSDALDNPQNANLIALTIEFDLPKTPDTINYEVWLSSSHLDFRSFLAGFADIGGSFSKEIAVFTPHYVLFYCYSCKTAGYTREEPDCLGGGRYCAPDPDQSGPLTGRDIVLEDLRQLCVYQLTEIDKNYKTWFNYIRHFNDTCAAGITTACSEEALDRADIETAEVKECIARSVQGSNVNLHDNTLLAAERKVWESSGIAFYPSITINNQTYRGDFEADEVKAALCASYNNIPSVCRVEIDDSDASQGLGVTAVLLIVFLCFGGVAGLLVLYVLYIRRQYRADLRKQVGEAVSQYIALNESMSMQQDSPSVRTYSR
jgi:hypothetical protein